MENILSQWNMPEKLYYQIQVIPFSFYLKCKSH